MCGKVILQLSFILFIILNLDSYADEANQVEPELHEFCQKDPQVVMKKKLAGYEIEFSQASDWVCGMLDIKRGKDLIYHEEGFDNHYYLGLDQKGIKPLEHLTGKKDLHLIILNFTAGAHCCFSLKIFRLSPDFALIGDIYAGNYYPFIRKGKPGMPAIIEIGDDFLAYQFSSFAYSAVGQVFLRPSRDKIIVASDLMKKPPPPLNSFNKRIPIWRDLIRKHEADWPPPDLIQTVTDLVFAGNKSVAFDLINRVWPQDVPGRDEFLASYEAALRDSLYFRRFEAQQ